jgi:hypothetical protein
MYRLQFHFEVAKGQARHAMAASERLKELAGQRGWSVPRLWHVAFGPFNRYIEESEYESLAAFEAASDAQQSDKEYLSLWRSRSDVVVPGTGSLVLLEEAS